MRAALLLLVAVLGCGGVHRYAWTADSGRRCFSTCQRGFYECRTSCRGNGFCVGGCQDDVEACADGCPDLQHTSAAWSCFFGCRYVGTALR